MEKFLNQYNIMNVENEDVTNKNISLFLVGKEMQEPHSRNTDSKLCL